MNCYLIFLRGVMPSGKNRVPMAKLKEILEKNKFKNVKTYIQSGNIILFSTASAEAVQKKVYALINSEIGAETDVFARSLEDMRSILRNSPFKKPVGDKNYYTLLSATPSKEKLNSFNEIKFSPDKVIYKDDVIYSEYKTLISNSKFNNNFYEKKLSVRGTTRNFNTMTKMLALAEEMKAK